MVRKIRQVLDPPPASCDCRFVLQVKWLSFIEAVLIELSAREASTARASSISKELCPLLLEGLDHPFKACREEIARYDLRWVLAKKVFFSQGQPRLLQKKAVDFREIARESSDETKAYCATRRIAEEG